MSVYTSVSTTELEIFLAGYTIGDLLSYSGIKNGITNSNYWLETEQGKFVLTLYEYHQPKDLDYILGLQHHLANQGVACATPVIDNQQRYYSTLNNRPAAINNRIKGHVCRYLAPRHCMFIGTELAKFHLAGKNYRYTRFNPRGKCWILSMPRKLQAHLKMDDQKLLDDEINNFHSLNFLNLPGGPTHLDLFHDNCLFDGDKLGGIIDFDYACDEVFLYDLAIALNDCCIQKNGDLDAGLVRAFIDAYESLRPLQAIEQDNLTLMLRLAATRFWLSRLQDQIYPPLVGDLTFTKDPDEFKNILLLRRTLS